MIAAICVIGSLAEAATWALVWRRHRSVWSSLAPVLAAAGIAAVATGRVNVSPRVSTWLAAGSGVAGGLGLYVATRAFVAVVGPWWPAFRRHAAALYGQQGELSLAATLVLALAVVAGEELFWRGLVQPAVAGDAGRTAGAVFAWLAYVAANLPSGNLPIDAGAVVGGAAWAAFAWWTGGALGPLACHCVWTALMIAFPPLQVGTQRRPDRTAGGAPA